MPPPLIIADSDEEEDEDFQPPISPRILAFQDGAVDPTRSLGQASHATSSTDPAFFQTIYDEQNDPSGDHISEDRTDRPNQDRLSSSEVTAPAPYIRKVTGIADSSSLTSLTDPTVVKDRKSLTGNGISDLTQVSTPGRMAAPVAKMDNLWDVPSSPEKETKRRIKIRFKKREPERATEAAQSPLAELDQPHNYHQESSGNAPEEDDDFPPIAKRKRRKVDYSQTSPQLHEPPIIEQGQESNEVDLVAIPFTNSVDPGDTTSSMLPPTLPPMQNDRSFYVAARHLTESERMEYESVEPVSSDQGPGILPPILNLYESSGSATNVNTPRSQMQLPSTAPRPTLEVTLKTKPRQRRDSSPDIIAMNHSFEPPQTARREEPEAYEPPNVPALETQELNQVQSNDDAAYEEEAEPTPPPTKSKKPRGRPKKSTVGETPSTTSPQKVADEVVEKKQKKKRGRPRKSEQPTAVETKPEAEAIATEGTVLTEEEIKPKPEVKAPKTRKKAVTRIDDSEDEEPELENPAKEENIETPVAEADHERLPLEAEESEADSITKPDPGRRKSADPEELGDSRAKKGTIKTDTKPKETLSWNSKPLYRVGLSKRSRIAPLLKSVRKPT